MNQEKNNQPKINQPIQQSPQSPPIPPPPPRRFVSVIFREGSGKLYDYFIESYHDLQINDLVEVPVRDKFTGEIGLNIAIVRYISKPGERSERAFATVLRKIEPLSPSQPTPLPTPKPSPPPILPTEKRFVSVIFKKRAKKRFDYLLGDNYDVRVDDFVVVHVNISGKTTWKIAKVVYISLPGEVSPYAKSAVIKKADYPKW